MHPLHLFPRPQSCLYLLPKSLCNHLRLFPTSSSQFIFHLSLSLSFFKPREAQEIFLRMQISLATPMAVSPSLTPSSFYPALASPFPCCSPAAWVPWPAGHPAAHVLFKLYVHSHCHSLCPSDVAKSYSSFKSQFRPHQGGLLDHPCADGMDRT